MITKTFSKKEAIKFGWETTKSNFGFFVILLIIAGFLSFAPEIITKITENSFISFLVTVISSIVSIIIFMGLVKISLLLHDNKEAKIKDLFLQYPLFFNYLLASILYGLIVFVGLILLVIPGIIWGIKFWFFDYLIIDKKLGPVEALKESAKITKGVGWNLFLFFLLAMLIIWGGFIALGVGLFVAIPVTMMASIYIYRKLLNSTTPPLKEVINE